MNHSLYQDEILKALLFKRLPWPIPSDIFRAPVGMPTGINNNEDLEIGNTAVTLRLVPVPVTSIDTAP
jgi:hypothetical protein